jgi:hypothetical protein
MSHSEGVIHLRYDGARTSPGQHSRVLTGCPPVALAAHVLGRIDPGKLWVSVDE